MIRYCETKQFWRKIVIPGPSLNPNNFDTRNFLKHRRVPRQNFSVLWDKNFRRKMENLNVPPPPLIQSFSIPEINATVKDSPTEISALLDKKFSTVNLDTPPPPVLSINFFPTGNFLKHSTEGFTYKIFRHCEKKNFHRKSKIVT